MRIIQMAMGGEEEALQVDMPSEWLCRLIGHKMEPHRILQAFLGKTKGHFMEITGGILLTNCGGLSSPKQFRKIEENISDAQDHQMFIIIGLDATDLMVGLSV